MKKYVIEIGNDETKKIRITNRNHIKEMIKAGVQLTVVKRAHKIDDRQYPKIRREEQI